VRIFLSHASQQVAVAEAVAIALRNAGHDVFLDKDSLPAAQSYDDRIRAAIGRSDVFLFLISPESVDSGRYTLTELKFARERWPRPGNKVLPVMAVDTPIADVPAYLRALNILKPEGNLVAEVAALVEKSGSTGPAIRIAAVLAAVVLVVGGLGGGAWWITHNTSTVAKKVALQAQVDNCAVVNELLQLKSPDQLSEAAVRQGAMCRELAALQGGDPREKQVADLMAQGEVDQALGLLEQMAKQPPETAERWERLATLAALRAPEKAVAAREAILRIAPDNQANRLALAATRLQADRMEDGVHLYEEVVARSSDAFTRQLAQANLCLFAADAAAAHPAWECDKIGPQQLVESFKTTTMDKHAGAEAASAVLGAASVKLSASMGGADLAVLDANAQQLKLVVDASSFFTDEMLKTITSKGAGELLSIQREELRALSAYMTDLYAAARAGDKAGYIKANQDIDTKFTGLMQRLEKLAVDFNTPLVHLEHASLDSSQGLFRVQILGMDAAALPGGGEAAISRLRECLTRIKTAQAQMPKQDVSALAGLLIQQWKQLLQAMDPENNRPDLASIKTELGAMAVEWVGRYAAANPDTTDTRFQVVQATFYQWLYSEGAVKATAEAKSRAGIADVRLRPDAKDYLELLDKFQAALDLTGKTQKIDTQGSNVPDQTPPPASGGKSPD
jgi:tetratricopeptide (TPR) repeat protein